MNYSQGLLGEYECSLGDGSGKGEGVRNLGVNVLSSSLWISNFCLELGLLSRCLEDSLK